ncbi:MAG: hypothetical protein R2857_13015 [Vampirovibrionales bacterium]
METPSANSAGQVAATPVETLLAETTPADRPASRSNVSTCSPLLFNTHVPPTDPASGMITPALLTDPAQVPNDDQRRWLNQFMRTLERTLQWPAGCLQRQHFWALDPLQAQVLLNRYPVQTAAAGITVAVADPSADTPADPTLLSAAVEALNGRVRQTIEAGYLNTTIHPNAVFERLKHFGLFGLPPAALEALADTDRRVLREHVLQPNKRVASGKPLWDISELSPFVRVSRQLAEVLRQQAAARDALTLDTCQPVSDWELAAISDKQRPVVAMARQGLGASAIYQQLGDRPERGAWEITDTLTAALKGIETLRHAPYLYVLPNVVANLKARHRPLAALSDDMVARGVLALTDKQRDWVSLVYGVYDEKHQNERALMAELGTITSQFKPTRQAALTSLGSMLGVSLNPGPAYTAEPGTILGELQRGRTKLGEKVYIHGIPADVEALPDTQAFPYRTILHRRYVDGQSNTDIAAALGLDKSRMDELSANAHKYLLRIIRARLSHAARFNHDETTVAGQLERMGQALPKWRRPIEMLDRAPGKAVGVALRRRRRL